MMYIPDEDDLTQEDKEFDGKTDPAANNERQMPDIDVSDNIRLDDGNSEDDIFIIDNNDINYDESSDFTDMDLSEAEKLFDIDYNEDKEDNEDYNKAEDFTDEETAETANKKRFAKSLIKDLIFYVVLIFVCIYIIPNFVLQRTIVDGNSMEYTLEDKDQLYVEKLSYRFDALKRFDIIVFYPFGRDHEDYYVKRIIGLPGEKVQIIDGNIYINDELLVENYGKEPIERSGRAEEPIYLADDEYFVLGDNRNNSRDSRDPSVGNVKKENIGGRVVLRIYPFDKFGFVE